MTKRLIALILAALMLTALAAGCSKSGYPEDVPETPAAVTQPPADTGPDISTFDYSAALDENGFFKGVDASDYVKLPDYKGISVPAEVLTASDEDVQAQIDGIMSRYTQYEQITDRAVEEGDTVNIDYVGSIDGVEFEGGSTQGAGTFVTIGVTQYIDDFLEQLIGHVPGETLDVNVTFPEDYGNEELSGKDAVFKVTINYIEGEAINAELTDEISQEIGFENADELVEYIKSQMVMAQKYEFAQQLLAETSYEKVPQSLLDFIIDCDLNNYEFQAAQYQMERDEFITAYTGYESVDAYIEANNAGYVQSAVYYLACQAIAEQEGLTVTDDDVASSGFEQYKDAYGLPYIKMTILQFMLIPDFIANNASIQ
ncbi:MAG: FKBP-type peptidyl-prolyl cis-trans isomerase [Oscillospiraceae bacterium]|jgi:trigger factor